jgi:integrase
MTETRHLAEPREPRQRGTPLAGATPPAPYSPAERAELVAVAAVQRDPASRCSALALVVFGIGAGLRPGELLMLRGSDVARHGCQVVVQVGGAAARVVPVTSRYAGRAAELARGAGTGYLFRPGPADRGYKNFVTNFARSLTRMDLPGRGCSGAGLIHAWRGVAPTLPGPVRQRARRRAGR